MIIKKRGLFLLVVSLFFLILISDYTSSEATGCYTYPQANLDLYCAPGTGESAAKTDCAQHSDCNINQYFQPGSDCQDIPSCQDVTCTIDGLPNKLGKCQQAGGEAILPGEEFLWNTPGCCKVSERFCRYGLLKFQCLQEGKKRGVDTPLFDTKEGMNQETCNRDYCQFNITKGTVFGIIKDEQEQLLSGVEVTIEEISASSDSAGKYSFSNLEPGSYLLKASKAGFLTNSVPFSLSSGENKEVNVILRAGEGVAKIVGIVKTLSGEQETTLAEATISWRSPESSGQAASDNTGNYQTTRLPAGTYILTASKIGYKAQEKTITLTSAEPQVKLDFLLEKAVLQGIKGIVYLDENNNKQLDGEDKIVYGAKIYLDGVFKGRSQYPTGEYEIEATTGMHALSANYPSGERLVYEFEGNITLGAGASMRQSLLLTTYIGECTEPGTEKNIESFTVTPVLGKKQILLNWVKPCPEVIAYQITKNGKELPGASALENSYLDLEELEWGQTYTYTISAVYPLKTTEAVSQTLALGDKDCEARYHGAEDGDTGWENFCLIGDKKTRQTLWTCDSQNKLIVSDNCAEKEGGSYYCARTSPRDATCKNSGECRFGADPFGLSYSRENCYGSSLASPEERPKNYCYYDFTNTIVDECKSCTEIKSCFDYESKDACVINSCFGSKCQWIDGAANSEPVINYNLVLPGLATPETGAGYCVEDKYSKDDHCAFCGSEVPLFENFFCTAEICSGLGRCFSNSELSQCEQCGEFPDAKANCYTYNTEKECIGKRGIESDPFGRIILSEDRCGWKRCLWQGESNGFGTGSCIKDGNADEKDDCADFIDSGERQNCELDVSPPQTVIIPEGVKIISSVQTNLTFVGDDSAHESSNQRSKMGLLGYCLSDTKSKTQSLCFREGFTTVNYPQKKNNEVVIIDLINSPFLSGKEINGETYRLLFYSEDRYKNRENLREAFIYIDNVAPKFEIAEKIETIADTTKLFIFLQDLSEPAECTFKLNSILPLGEVQSKIVNKDIRKKEVTFENLKGAIYHLNVTCIDNQGNINTKDKSYSFDLEPEIDLVYPLKDSFLAETSISFQVKTTVGSICALYNPITNEKIADFLGDEEGKIHHTETLPGFFEKEYLGEQKVVCKEILTGAEKEDYFSFTIDFTPPETKAYLNEGNDKREPQGANWEESFIRSAKIKLECQAEGFECDKIYYCLTGIDDQSCALVSNPNYKEYTNEFEVTGSSSLCYYSADKAQNSVFQANCGKIKIDGYGITLEAPELYYYLDENNQNNLDNQNNQNEMWGISNQPIFNWQFFTKVPTKECRFDFVSGFEYGRLPTHKIKLINEEKKYLFNNFPASVLTEYKEQETKSVYVICENPVGEKSPEQKMNLEYDPTAPVIEEASANPNPVFEGITTNLTVVTDDKTICKYDDNSAGEASSEFTHMSYILPQGEERQLYKTHRDIFTITSFGDDGKKDYKLSVLCKNGAGDFSELGEIAFSVDYSQVGFIKPDSLRPLFDYLREKSTTLSAETNKDASCEFDLSGLERAGVGGAELGKSSGYQRFESPFGKFHSQYLPDLVEKEYKIPIKCTMGDHVDYKEIRFIVDVTPPSIASVEDGNYTCGSSEINILVNTPNELNLSGYYLELYDLGEAKELTAIATAASAAQTSAAANKTISYTQRGKVKLPTPPVPPVAQVASRTNPSNAGVNLSETARGTGPTLVFSANYAPKLPLSISTANLSLNHKYIFKVKAGDKADNWASLKESNGIYVVAKNYTICVMDTSSPKIDSIVNESCTNTLVSLTCNDLIGCKNIKFGQALDAGKCVANNTYNGQNIIFKKSGWLCYNLSDYKNQNSSGKKEILFVDKDGDSIADKCDLCAETGAGKIVNEKGCADGEHPAAEMVNDTDKDSLPDFWEKKYNSELCKLDYQQKDSNNNSILDGAEDYDKDGRKNYEEFLSDTKPCVAEARTLPPPGELPEPPRNITKAGEKKIEGEDKKEEGKKEADKKIVPGVKPSSLLPLICLILGLLLFLGGTGYLIYYYKSVGTSRKTMAAAPPVRRVEVSSKQTAPSGPGLFSTLKDKLQLKRAYEEKIKARKREETFSGFGKSSSEIPHLGSLLEKKSPQLSHLQNLAQKYVEHKEEIKPGLKTGEKSIFAKLENIAQQTKEKPIHEVVSKGEAQDIFSKLKDISAKRKGK